MSIDIACVGHACLDHHFEVKTIPQVITKTAAHGYQMIVGGMAANAAVAAARLGAGVRLISRVGDDAAGAFICEALKSQGVQTQIESVSGAQTSVSSVIVDDLGERQVFNHRGNALAQGAPLDAQLLTGAQAVLCDTRWPRGARSALQWAKSQGVFSMLDGEISPMQDLRDLVPLTDWVVFSKGGLSCFAPNQADMEAALREALSMGAKLAMVTLGENGVLWTDGDSLQRQESFQVKPVDTTGAGDCFHAALTYAVAKNGGANVNVREAVRFACAAAAIKCTHPGGILGAPNLFEIESFLAIHLIAK